MSFLHPALLIGLGLVAIPVILHLWMRPRPKRLPFPALRLLKTRQRSNSRRLNLRHLWLLLLRMAMIALMVFAVTRPTLPPANYALSGRESLVGLVILAVAAATYFGVMHSWKRKSWPRHIWLTRRTVLRGLLGGITVLLLILGVAWPYQRRIAAEIVSPHPHVAADLPVTAVYLFDTSLSMGYQHQNRTRLQVAQELAGAHLGRLPGGSRIAIADSGTAPPMVFSSDFSAAQNRLDGLKPFSRHHPLEERIRAAIHALENDRVKTLSDQSGVAEENQQDRYLREIYLFTDLAKSGWKIDASQQLREEIAARPWLGIYLVDVGLDEPVNVSLTDLKLSREAVSVGSPITVEATLRTRGEVPPEQTVELELLDAIGTTVKQAQQRIAVTKDGEWPLKFFVDFGTEEMSRSYRQGQLKLVGADPLGFDDQVYFSVRILPPRRVLVVSDKRSDVQLWMLMLDSLQQGKRTSFETQFVETNALANVELEDFDIVCLINAGRPEATAWEKLRSFVDAGGGLWIALGTRSTLEGEENRGGIDPVAYEALSALELLPGKLKGARRLPAGTTMDFREKSHPLIQRIDDIDQAISTLSNSEIRRCWSVTPDADAITIVSFASELQFPALMERAVGRGRVLQLNTAVNSTAWNDLYDNWAFLVLVDQSMNYLTASSAGRSNWTVGSPVMMRLDPEPVDRACVLKLPDFKQLPQSVPKLTSEIRFRDLSALGQYELVAADQTSNFALGFSLNVPSEESQLTKLTKDDLDGLLGEQRYALSKDIESLARNVMAGRLGQEVYSLIVAVLLAVFVLEQVTGAWFYRTDELPASDAVSTTSHAKRTSSVQLPASRT